MGLPDKNTFEGRVLLVIDEMLKQKLALEHGQWVKCNDEEFKTFLDDGYSENEIKDVINDNIELLVKKGYLKILNTVKTMAGNIHCLKRKRNLCLEDLYTQEEEVEREQAEQMQKQKDAEELHENIKKTNKMKIFISHSSKNKFYGDKLVDLLRNVGVKENEIIFTSNTAYGIPVGENIFNWLKSQITDKPFVIYLLSEEYYQSIACLNEMGAAWIIENKHAALFTPNFNLSSKEFQSGALDPREIGFHITDEARILSFLQLISEDFEISKNHNIISQGVRKFLAEINDKTAVIKSASQDTKEIIKAEPNKEIPPNQTDMFSKFINLIISKKLKEDELILLHYIIETGRVKLMTGWQEQDEIANIKEWEANNELYNGLSINYSSTLKRFELRRFTEVSAVTSSNNPKELKVKDEISEHLLDLPEHVLNVIMEVVKKYKSEFNLKKITERLTGVLYTP